MKPTSLLEKEVDFCATTLAGGMHCVYSDIQKSCQRILCSQEQGRGFKQARSFP